jgi:hypothetical protein
MRLFIAAPHAPIVEPGTELSAEPIWGLLSGAGD